MTLRTVMLWIMLGFALLMILFAFLFSFQPAFAQEGGGSIVAPSSMWFEVWSIVQPLVTLLVTMVGPILVGWIAAQIIRLLKVTDEKQQLDIEAKLRDAIHQSAANALKFALARGGLSTPVANGVTGAVISEAIAYVQEKNPDALEKLGVDGSSLRDIIISKVPDLLGTGAKVVAR